MFDLRKNGSKKFRAPPSHRGFVLLLLLFLLLLLMLLLLLFVLLLLLFNLTAAVCLVIIVGIVHSANGPYTSVKGDL